MHLARLVYCYEKRARQIRILRVGVSSSLSFGISRNPEFLKKLLEIRFDKNNEKRTKMEKIVTNPGYCGIRTRILVSNSEQENKALVSRFTNSFLR